MKQKGLVVLLALMFVIGVSTCNQTNKPKAKSSSEQKLAYLNHHDSVGYVGINTCMGCHGNIHATYKETGMGSSFGKADTAKSAASFGRAMIYDTISDLYYKPFWKQGELYVEEFRLNGTDTVHKLIKGIDYIVGSGQHTNSHIFNENGYHFQAPFTWYAQKGKLDLPPGYEDGKNSRFTRPIGLECMSCHNAMPTSFVKGSYNKYGKIPEGIDCERCHGPGALHVKRVSSGNLVDTATQIDYSIVNPKKLDTQLQFELCQRCHLQGNAVLRQDKDFFSFRPGMELKSVMDVYLPRYENGEDQFIMASHADRLKLSKCFISAEGSFNCISCHNPHVSVRKTNLLNFNQVCTNCHQSTEPAICSEEAHVREAEDNNCVGCHMPASGSTDIPHVTVHDHYIRKPKESSKMEELGEFLGLKAINNTNPSKRSRALAYLQQYERFAGEAFMLDSAALIINQLSDTLQLALRIHLYSLSKNPEAIRDLVNTYSSAYVLSRFNTKDYLNRDAWLQYRVGEAMLRLSDLKRAEKHLQQAASLAPFVLDFKVKLANCYNRQNNSLEARKLYQEILAERPLHKEALNNLGYLDMLNRDYPSAEKAFQLVLEHHPDYEQAWLNKAQLYILQENEIGLRNALQEVIRINPANQKANQLLNQLGS